MLHNQNNQCYSFFANYHSFSSKLPRLSLNCSLAQQKMNSKTFDWLAVRRQAAAQIMTHLDQTCETKRSLHNLTNSWNHQNCSKGQKVVSLVININEFLGQWIDSLTFFSLRNTPCFQKCLLTTTSDSAAVVEHQNSCAAACAVCALGAYPNQSRVISLTFLKRDKFCSEKINF